MPARSRLRWRASAAAVAAHRVAPLVADIDAAAAWALVLTRVPGEHGWYQGVIGGLVIRVRRNTRPGDNPCSVQLADDRLLELPALPAAWTLLEPATAPISADVGFAGAETAPHPSSRR